MRRSARAIVVVLVVAAASVACGSFHEAPATPPAPDASTPADGGATDGAPSDGAGGPDAVGADGGFLPRKPVTCPLFDCPANEPVCKDEACQDPGSPDFTSTGSVSIGGGACTTSAEPNVSSSMFDVRTRVDPRRHVTLSMKVLSANVAADRPIAAISADADPDGELFAIVAKGSGTFALCERAATGPRCTETIALTFPTTIHLYGVVTSTNPPNAAFALGLDTACTPLRVLDVSRPFAAGAVRGAVGCLAGAGACNVVFDDAVLLVAPE